MVGKALGDDDKEVKAAKGQPDKGPAKTTVKTVPPPEITPNKPKLVVVLNKAGNVPAKYPILTFEIKGPSEWFYDVQVSRHDADKLAGGPGLAGAWDKTKAPKDRLGQRLFSSWTNGEKALKLDGSGKAVYEMPLDWWKDLARQPLKDFTTEDFYYRVLVFRDAAAGSVVYSTKDKGSPPGLKIRNNLRAFKLTDLGYTDGGMRKPERVQFTVRRPDTTDMYTIVQWAQGSAWVWGRGNQIIFERANNYGIIHEANLPDLTVDSLTSSPRWGGDIDPLVTLDGKTAVAIDRPGPKSDSIGPPIFYMGMNFETRIHLNFEVPNQVKIIRKEGSAPVFGVVTGVLDDPQPFILDSGTWKVRIFRVRHADGTITVAHPDPETLTLQEQWQELWQDLYGVGPPAMEP